MVEQEYLEWQQQSETRRALWLSAHFTKAPTRWQIVDDQITADAAYRLACEGQALIWQGDYQNARQLLQAMGRRLDKAAQAKQKKNAQLSIDQQFHQSRLQQAQRASVLNRLLIVLTADGECPLPRAPSAKAAMQAAFAVQTDAYLLPLRAYLGAIGAYQWRENGVEVAALATRVYPHYGVFAPVRSEYLELVNQASLDFSPQLALDIGTGTGVLAAILARRGVPQLIATDLNPQAIATAEDTMQRLGLAEQVQVMEADLFPDADQHYDLIVCNPPWLPGKASSALEYAVYDYKSNMLKQVLTQGAERLTGNGQLWIIISDLAEHLQLRSRQQLLDWIAAAGLQVQQRLDTKPEHKRSQDRQDMFYQQRSQEVTSLWVLVKPQQ